MIPATQTILHDPENGKKGNCLSAVIASLLHLPIEEVPLFVEPEWRRDLNAFLRPFGLAYLDLSVDPAYLRVVCGITGLHHEITGTSPRNPAVLHGCVALDGNLVFDPHPSRDGIVGDPIEFTLGVFFALEPWKVAELYREAEAGVA